MAAQYKLYTSDSKYLTSLTSSLILTYTLLFPTL